MQQIGLGIIGCGMMAQVFLRHLLPLDSNLRIVCVHDPDERSLAKARELAGEGVRVCATHEEVCRDPAVDWVMIASWNCFHARQVIDALEAGKHVFAQKPLATTLGDAVAVRRAHEKAGTIFTLGYTLRYSPHYRKVRALLDGGRVGQVISMESNETLGFNHGGYIMGDWRRLRANAGTHLLEKCCHDVDLALWFAGSLPRRVASFGGLDFFKPGHAARASRLAPGPNGEAPYRAWGGLVGADPFGADKDIVDNQVAIVELESGARWMFHTNCNAAIPERRMVLLGTEGTIRSDVISGRIEAARIGFGEAVVDESTSAAGGHGGGDEVQAAELLETMRTGKVPAVSLRDALASTATCLAIDKAMDTGAVVDAREFLAPLGLAPAPDKG